MWDQSGYENAGGFMGSQSMGSQTPGGTGEKRKRAQNLCPMKIKDIQMAEEDIIKVEDREIGMVDLVGQVKSVEQTATKTVYILDDNSGEIEAIHWTDADAGESSMSGTAVTEGMQGRVIGSVRSQGGKKHIMVFRISPLESKAEADSHEIECVYAKFKLRQLTENENRAIGANSGLSNSMVGSSAMVGSRSMVGSGSMGASSMGNSSFANSKHEAVFKLLSGCTREEGLSRDEMLQTLMGKMTRKDLDDALEYLSGEGHIYSTTDEDHFKTTDG